MLRALESRESLESAQDEFKDAFEPYVEEQFPADIGYQGGYARRQVIWMPSIDLWAHFGDPPSEKGPPTRFWNVFGVGRPAGMVSIVCEINPPKKAKKYPPAGVFAIDETNQLAILHRGRLTMTGGIKTAFVERHIDGQWVHYLDRGVRRRAILVAKLPDPSFGARIQHFVNEIHRVKELKRGSR